MQLDDVDLDPKLFNHSKYDKKDELEMLELAEKIQNNHMPNYKKFPKSMIYKICRES